MVDVGTHDSIPPASTKLTPATIFAHHDTHPVVLDALMITAFKKDWWTWDAETIWEAIAQYFGPKTARGGGINISELTKNKIQAVKVLHGSDGFWRGWEVFTVTLQPLVNNIPRFDVLQTPTTAQLMAGVDVANTIVRNSFSEEVARFVAACCLNDGVWHLPPPLAFAQVHASLPKYECRDCGNVGETHPDDGLCDVCSGRWSGPKNIDGKPSLDSAYSHRGEGKNLRLYYENDPEPVRLRYAEVKQEGSTLQETQADVCVARLMVACDYMDLRQRQLAQQLKVVKPWLLVS
jgi:hypothetical protein